MCGVTVLKDDRRDIAIKGDGCTCRLGERIRRHLSSPRRAGDLPGTIEQLTQAVEPSQQDASAHADLGAALEEAGRISEAKIELEKALAIDPNHQMARENLALIQQIQK